LEILVVDNNLLKSVQKFPHLPLLHTLWVNSNNIEELKPFIDAVSVSFPNLKYLSMMKNPACPNFLTGKDEDDYRRYRHSVFFLSFLPLLPALTLFLFFGNEDFMSSIG
jgi:hypothetical protein